MLFFFGETGDDYSHTILRDKDVAKADQLRPHSRVSNNGGLMQE